MKRDASPNTNVMINRFIEGAVVQAEACDVGHSTLKPDGLYWTPTGVVT